MSTSFVCIGKVVCISWYAREHTNTPNPRDHLGPLLHARGVRLGPAVDAPSASIQCDTGMKQGEEYVKHLMCSYVSEYMNMYGIIARFALMELGVKVKVASTAP